MNGSGTVAVLLIVLALAPAPLPKPERRAASLPPVCVMTFPGGERWRATFYPDGTYRGILLSRSYPTEWPGTWRLSGRTLYVEERPPGAPPWAGQSWSVTLDRSLRHGVGADAGFLLEEE